MQLSRPGRIIVFSGDNDLAGHVTMLGGEEEALPSEDKDKRWRWGFFCGRKCPLPRRRDSWSHSYRRRAGAAICRVAWPSTGRSCVGQGVWHSTDHNAGTRLHTRSDPQSSLLKKRSHRGAWVTGHESAAPLRRTNRLALSRISTCMSTHVIWMVVLLFLRLFMYLAPILISVPYEQWSIQKWTRGKKEGQRNKINLA